MVTFFSIFTWGGSIVVLLPAALAGVVLSQRGRRWSNGLLLMGGVSGASVLANMLKQIFARPRPDVEAMLISVPSGFSFPSAHAAQAFAFATACCIIFGRDATPGRRIMLPFFFGGWAAAVAFSRVFLRVHFISDVIVGAVLGISWVVVMALLTKKPAQRNE